MRSNRLHSRRRNIESDIEHNREETHNIGQNTCSSQEHSAPNDDYTFAGFANNGEPNIEHNKEETMVHSTGQNTRQPSPEHATQDRVGHGV